MDKLFHATGLLGEAKLSKSDVAFLQHAAVERPLIYGNASFGKFRDAVKIRVLSEVSLTKTSIPKELAGTGGEELFSLVLDVYGQGKGKQLECSMVHHMMLNILQKLAGTPNPRISSKLFALGRALKHLHKPSYDFFRQNALVGPHVDTIRKFEAKHAESRDPVIWRDGAGTPIAPIATSWIRSVYVRVFTFQSMACQDAWYIHVHVASNQAMDADTETCLGK
jgi:hypothetical protein